MGMFGGIEGARTSEGGVYFKPGAYKARVVAVKALKDRKGIGTFVVETELVESSRDDLPKGTMCSWVVKLDKEPALGNIKAFIAAAMRSSTKDVNEAAVELVISEGNPLRDIVLKVSAQDIKTKAGNPFTKVTWSPDDAKPAATEEASK